MDAPAIDSEFIKAVLFFAVAAALKARRQRRHTRRLKKGEEPLNRRTRLRLIFSRRASRIQLSKWTTLDEFKAWHGQSDYIPTLKRTAPS